MTTATSNRNSRVPAGTPTGGRFAATARPETAVHLDPAPGQAETDVQTAADVEQIPHDVRVNLEDRSVVDCPACATSTWSPGLDERCSFCHADGFVSQPALEEYVIAYGEATPIGYRPGYVDTTREPDWAGLIEDRAVNLYDRYGASAEWGGMDVAS